MLATRHSPLATRHSNLIRLSNFVIRVCLLLASAACTSHPTDLSTGPTVLASVTSEAPTATTGNFQIVRTEHYQIFTTITDQPQFLQEVAQVMEGAIAIYGEIAPGVPTPNPPMQCYLFADRQQWAGFTQDHTGSDAHVYLQITRGGYTVRDWSALYYVGEISTLSVASHEGWHQFVNRHFIGRLPPFLEEGLACLFENIRWSEDLPRWKLSTNPARAFSLRKASDAKVLFPLEKLITMHAGDVVGQSPIKVESFYGQSWAFARFLRESDHGKYVPALQHLLSDTAAGTVFDPTASHRRSYLPWNPNGVRPMLEHYLGEDLQKISVEFEKFEHDIAYEQTGGQF
jgi:hypothetical protein